MTKPTGNKAGKAPKKRSASKSITTGTSSSLRGRSGSFGSVDDWIHKHRQFFGLLFKSISKKHLFLIVNVFSNRFENQTETFVYMYICIYANASWHVWRWVSNNFASKTKPLLQVTLEQNIIGSAWHNTLLILNVSVLFQIDLENYVDS